MEKTLTFERARIGEADTLVKFEERLADPRLYGAPSNLERARREIRRNRLYFVKSGDAIVGTAAFCSKPGDRVYISNVAVDPRYRRQGIARAALTFILGRCTGATRIELVTHPENEAALRLYGSFGFEIKSRHENYFGDGEPRLVMSREPIADRRETHVNPSGSHQTTPS
jgi:[ribosomal protein S18]-alanine N-acetyltransferase